MPQCLINDGRSKVALPVQDTQTVHFARRFDKLGKPLLAYVSEWQSEGLWLSIRPLTNPCCVRVRT